MEKDIIRRKYNNDDRYTLMYSKIKNSDGYAVCGMETDEHTDGKVQVQIRVEIDDGGINHTVTRIDAGAFKGKEKITGVSIPGSVTRIGDRAFEGCVSLSSVTFGENAALTSVGDSAFFGCRKLKNSENDSVFALPDSVTEIGDKAFEGCTGLTAVPWNTSSGLKSIGSFAFRNCSITDVTIPGSVTEIGVGAFQGCNNLQRISGMGGVRYIGYRAFYNDAGRTLSICGKNDSKDMQAALEKIRYMGEETFHGRLDGKGGNIELKACNPYSAKIDVDAVEPDEINARQEIDKFMGVYTADPESRYRMYDHTHEKFREYRNARRYGKSDAAQQLIFDELPLYLDMYLASWGMFRNSFLQFKDYRFLEGICEIVCEDRYAWLMDVDPFEKVDVEGRPDPETLRKYVHDILELKDRITYYFEDGKSFYKPDSVEEQIDSVTDTQVTKILLVTLGCIPAYDSYVVNALKKLGVKNPSIKGDKLADMLNLAWKLRDPIRKEMARYAHRVGTVYSFMKYVDMALWGYGFFPGDEDE